jgi:hypothetical protein
MWMACWTLDEIAEQEDLDKAQVSRICCETADLPKLNKPDPAAASHATNFWLLEIASFATTSKTPSSS